MYQATAHQPVSPVAVCAESPGRHLSKARGGTRGARLTPRPAHAHTARHGHACLPGSRDYESPTQCSTKGKTHASIERDSIPKASTPPAGHWAEQLTGADHRVQILSSQQKPHHPSKERHGKKSWHNPTATSHERNSPSGCDRRKAEPSDRICLTYFGM